MAEETKNNTNDEVNTPEVEGFYQRLFSDYQEHLQGKLHESSYLDGWGICGVLNDGGKEINSYANRKAIESVKKAGHQNTPEVSFANNVLRCIKFFEDNYGKEKIKLYRWDNEEQRAIDDEIEWQKQEAKIQEEIAERQRIEAALEKRRKEEAERQRIEAERQRRNAEKQKNKTESHDAKNSVNKPTNETAETKVTDFDFEAFLAEIGKPNPDMSVIKAGVEKFGTGELDGALKEQFLKTIFPNEENNHLTDQSKKLGFENVTGIKNTLNALKEIQADKTLDPKVVENIVGNVITAKYPQKDGKNMAMTLALNVRAAEFKLKKFTDQQDIATMKNNLQSYSEALALMGQIEHPAIKKSLGEIYKPAGMKRELKVNDLAAKSKVLSEFLKDPAAYKAISPEEALTVEGENTTVIGGNDGITVNGENKKGLTVNSRKTDEDTDEEKIAPVEPQKDDDKKKKSPFEWEKVKEQDIIQYMFENWFLGGLNWALKAPLKLLDKCLDAIDSKFDASIPKSPLKDGEVEKNAKAVKFLNNRGAEIASACMTGMETQRDYYEALHDTIKENIGKQPDTWVSKHFNGKPVLDTSNPLDINKIKNFNDMFGADKAAFLDNLESLKNISDNDFKAINLYTQIGARLAVSQYMAANPNGPFDNESENMLKKMALDNTHNIMKTIKNIHDRVEYNYRFTNGITPDTPLNDAQKAEISSAAGGIVEKFIDDLTDRGADLRNSVYNYNKRNDKTDKQRYGKEMKERLNDMNNILDVRSEGYIDSICPSEYKGKAAAPVSLYDMAKIEIESARLEKSFNDYLGRSVAQLTAAKEEITERLKAYKENPKYRRIAYSLSRTSGKIGRTTDKVKSVGKEVAAATKEGAKVIAKKGVDSIVKLKNSLFGRKI